MTQLLKQAFDRASLLQSPEQDAVARWLLDELDSEQTWDQLFARSQNVLSNLADEALTEHRAGRTLPLNPENM